MAKKRKLTKIEIDRFHGSFSGVVGYDQNNNHVGTVVKLKIPKKARKFGGKETFVTSKNGENLRAHKSLKSAVSRFPKLSPKMPRLK